MFPLSKQNKILPTVTTCIGFFLMLQQMTINLWLKTAEIYYLTILKAKIISVGIRDWRSVSTTSLHVKASIPYVSVCAQACPTLCDPIDCSPPGSSVHGVFPGKNTGVGFQFLLQRDPPDPGIEPPSPASAGGFFTTEPPGWCYLEVGPLGGNQVREEWN